PQLGTTPTRPLGQCRLHADLLAGDERGRPAAPRAFPVWPHSEGLPDTPSRRLGVFVGRRGRAIGRAAHFATRLWHNRRGVRPARSGNPDGRAIESTGATGLEPVTSAWQTAPGARTGSAQALRSRRRVSPLRWAL